MTREPFYKAHWREIAPERMAAYRAGFGWDAATEALYAPAEIGAGQIVADFGCGPGKVALELARRVGPGGHVHALDINAEFLAIAEENAAEAGLSDRLTTHPSEGAALPFADGALDRVTARNTLMYVDDPVATLREFHRVLRPGGLAHAIDGDWFMMVVEPVDHDLWRDFVKAAAHACRNADMGRKLRGAFRAAGFGQVEVGIDATADVTGRLLGMVRNMGAYARESGAMDPEALTAVLAQVEAAHTEDRLLIVSPQFVLRGRKAG